MNSRCYTMPEQKHTNLIHLVNIDESCNCRRLSWKNTHKNSDLQRFSNSNHIFFNNCCFFLRLLRQSERKITFVLKKERKKKKRHKLVTVRVIVVTVCVRLCSVTGIKGGPVKGEVWPEGTSAVRAAVVLNQWRRLHRKSALRSAGRG